MHSLFRCSTMALLLLSPASAFAWNLPFKIDCGINARFNVYWKDQNSQQRKAPWYTYFPYEAHFQMQAPNAGNTGYPTWPSREQWQQMKEQQGAPKDKPAPMPPPAPDPKAGQPAPNAPPEMLLPVLPPSLLQTQQTSFYGNPYVGSQPIHYQPTYQQVPYYWYGR